MWTTVAPGKTNHTMMIIIVAKYIVYVLGILIGFRWNACNRVKAATVTVSSCWLLLADGQNVCNEILTGPVPGIMSIQPMVIEMTNETT